jgi:protein TonB
MDGGQSGTSAPPPATPARAAVDVIALTTRDDFLLELGAALGGQASVNPVDSTEQALALLVGARRTQILMIDSRDVSDVRSDIESVRTKAPQVDIIVFADVAQEQSLTETLQGVTVSSILTLPVDAGQTTAAFSAAVASAKLKEPAPSSESRGPILLSPEPFGGTAVELAQNDSTGGSQRFTKPVVLGAVAALVAIGGIAAYFMTRHQASPSSAASSPVAEPRDEAAASAQVQLPAVETSIVKGKVDELLEKARLAMRERRFAEPAGDNALLYYRSAAATDPGNGEAQDGLNRVAGVLAGRFEDALGSSQLDDAATALAQFKNAIPEDPRGAAFQQRLTGAQVSKAMADGNMDRAAALVRGAQQNNLLPAAQVSRWRSEISRLQEEARQKRAADQAARDTLAAAEQKKAREARTAAAAEAERQAQVARDKEREEQAKAEQAAQSARTSTAADSASSRGAMALQSTLKRKRYVAPEYPMEALSKEVGGVVQIEFTVDKNGETRDIHVVNAEPAGVFDRAAISAVKRWRYEPAIVDGAATEVPVRLNIRFAPPQ